MNKKQIQKLASESYKNNSLDEKTVLKISSMLRRKELKGYIQILKNKEKEKTVEIYLTKLPSQKLKDVFLQVYQNKKIVYKIDKSLIGGVKIIENDMIYNLNIENILNQMVLNIINL